MEDIVYSPMLLRVILLHDCPDSSQKITKDRTKYTATKYNHYRIKYKHGAYFIKCRATEFTDGLSNMHFDLAHGVCVSFAKCLRFICNSCYMNLYGDCAFLTKI